MNKLFCILGPTATGKTDLGLMLAKRFDGEIVACDSRQVYIGLDIGTGKLPSNPAGVRKKNGYWEIDGIKVWMYDVASLNTQYTVADYVKNAEEVIKDIISRGKIPIIVGGTGLYIKALFEGLPNLSVPLNKKLRGELEKLNLEELQSKLKLLSPTRWEKLNNSDKQNPRRLLRAIELLSMNPYVGKVKNSELRVKNYNILKIGLTAPRDQLYKSVDLRVFDWIKQGIIEEVEEFLKKWISTDRFRQLGLEYRIIADFLDGKFSKDKLIKTIQNNIHGYVRRQLTWFKKTRGVNWFYITDNRYQEDVEKLAYKWYYKDNDKKD